MDGKLIQIKEAADRSGYCEQHLRQLCRKKKVAHVRRGSRYFFTPEQVERLTVVVEPGAKPADGETAE